MLITNVRALHVSIPYDAGLALRSRHRLVGPWPRRRRVCHLLGGRKSTRMPRSLPRSAAHVGGYKDRRQREAIEAFARRAG